LGKKILLVANTDWYLFNFRISLAFELVNDGFEVVFVCPSAGYTEQIRSAGFRVIAWEVERKTAPFWDELRSISTLNKIYKQECPNLVHHFTIKPILYGSLAARLAGVKAVINSITGRGYIFQDSSGKPVFLRPLTELMFRTVYKGLNAATTFENVSDKVFFTENGLVPKERNWLVNGVGVDTDWFYYAPEQPADELLIVFPGRLLWSKGVGVLVEAARILKAHLPVRIVLIGRPDPGNPETISEEVIRDWEAEGVIEWWGWQSSMREIYHQSHVVVLPSMGEGLSKALLEAISCGRPIVATDVPGCREVVVPGVTGYLVPPNNIEALAEKLERLCTNPDLRRQMGLSGRRLAEEEFTDVKINREIKKIYASMI
jgi:glycosyltransferase involved in cell wall biosynthesis